MFLQAFDVVGKCFLHVLNISSLVGLLLLIWNFQMISSSTPGDGSSKKQFRRVCRSVLSVCHRNQILLGAASCSANGGSVRHLPCPLIGLTACADLHTTIMVKMLKIAPGTPGPMYCEHMAARQERGLSSAPIQVPTAPRPMEFPAHSKVELPI